MNESRPVPLLPRTSTITAEVLRQCMHYDSETGVFTRIKKTSPSARVGKAAGSNQHGYLAFHIAGVLCRAHRMAWLYVYGVHPNGFLDHINGVRDDNRICNLREATPGQNCQNQPIGTDHNKLGFKGVCFDDRRRLKHFTAWVSHNRKRTYLGSFSTPEEAHAAYLAAKRALHEYFHG